MILNSPFPLGLSRTGRLRYAFFAGLIVFLILFLFRPFNIDGAGNHFNVVHAFIYGAATSVMVMLNSMLLPVIFRSSHKEESWTLGKEMLVMGWHVLSIAFVNLLITHYLYGLPLSWINVLNFLLITAMVGIFPVAFILLIKQQVLYRRFNRGANAIEEELAATVPVDALSDNKVQKVLLKGDNQGEDYELGISSIRYITAADNYLRIVCMEGDKVNSIVLRSTLKKAEQMLKDHPVFLRCHRAYIVNLASVKHVSGNAQGFKLHLQNVSDVIPVSRTLNESLQGELKKFSQLVQGPGKA